MTAVTRSRCRRTAGTRSSPYSRGKRPTAVLRRWSGWGARNPGGRDDPGSGAESVRSEADRWSRVLLHPCGTDHHLLPGRLSDRNHYGTGYPGLSRRKRRRSPVYPGRFPEGRSLHLALITSDGRLVDAANPTAPDYTLPVGKLPGGNYLLQLRDASGGQVGHRWVTIIR